MKKHQCLILLDNIPKNLHKFEIRYWKQDEWDDRLEKAIAFGLIASHRLEQLDPPLSFGGESLPYVIRLNKYLGWTWLTTWSEHGLMMAYGVYWLMDGWLGAIPADKWLVGETIKLPSSVHRVWKTEVPCLTSPQELRKVSRWFVFHQGPVMTCVNLFQHFVSKTSRLIMMKHP